MKKVWILGFVLLTVLFGAGNKKLPANIPASKVDTRADVKVTADPLVQQMVLAKANGDRATYQQLLKEWQRQNQKDQSQTAPILFSEQHPHMSWADDKVIYAGTVNYNTWAASTGIDDEAIDVDYVNGDTLRAAIALPDTSLIIYQSTDLGLTWAWWHQIIGFGGAVYEPQIVYQGAGWTHLFCRVSTNNGDLININYDPSDNFTYTWLDNTADTIADYSVCSDRVEYSTDCWLFLDYHKQLGGPGYDGIWFMRSLDHGQTWSTATQLQGSGSGYSDLAFSANNYLYRAYIYHPTGTTSNIQTRRSSDEGGTWYGSVLVQGDTCPKTTPKIAGAHSTQNNAWVVWGHRYAYSPYDWDVLWSWTQDAGATWSTWGYCVGYSYMHDVMPSISTFDNSGTYDTPYISLIQSADTAWNNPKVQSTYWQTDSTWATITSYSDSVPAYTSPVQCWENPGYPAIAYVGAAGVNVYYDSWSNTGVEEGKKPVITGNLLSPNQPNPFRVSTRFQYTVPTPGRVTIAVYNTLGQKVAGLIDEYKGTGTYQASYNGSALPRGIYFLKYQCGKANLTRKLIVE
jgi:hypothetical protein